MTFGHMGKETGMAQPIPKLWEREWEASIPEKGREREFLLTPADYGKHHLMHHVSYNDVAAHDDANPLRPWSVGVEPSVAAALLQAGQRQQRVWD